MIRKLLLTLVVALLAAGLASCRYSSRPPGIGSAAPDFVLTENGRSIRLSEMRDKIVVLNFWATWCPPCIEEMPSLTELQRRMKDKIVVLAVSVDVDDRAYRDFLRNNNIELLTVRDPQQKSNTLYGSFRFPETYVIDREGKVRRKFVGPANWTNPEIMEYLDRL